MEKVPMTGEGYRALDEELKRLKSVERPNVIAAIAAALPSCDVWIGCRQLCLNVVPTEKQQVYRTGLVLHY